jgi:hypothetical protein
MPSNPKDTQAGLAREWPAFVRIVAATRDAQKSYKLSRSTAVLGECRNLEAALDKMLDAILGRDAATPGS